jgi:hypothetical protein
VHRTDSVDDAYDWLIRKLIEEALGKPGAMLLAATTELGLAMTQSCSVVR